MNISHYRFLSASLIGFTSAFCFSQPLLAAESDVYQLSNIIVDDTAATGTRYTVDQADLDLLGARSLEDALRLSPSINTRYGGDGTPRMDIRGLRTRQIKLLVNGIPYNSSFDGQFDPSLIPAFAIGRVDVNVGSSSVLYGDGGTAGIIDIKTRGARNGFDSSVQAEAGSDNYWLGSGHVSYGDANQDLFLAYGIRDKNDFSVANNYDSPLDTTASNYQSDGKRNNSDNRRENFVISYYRNLGDKLTLGMFSSYLNGEYGKPPITLDNNEDDYASRAKFERVESQHGYSFQIGADYDFNQDWSAKLWFFNNKLEEHNAGYDDLNLATHFSNGTYDSNDETTVQGVHSQLNGVLAATQTQLAVSADYRKEHFQQQGFECNSGGKKSCPTVAYTAISNEEDINVRSYAVEVTQPLPYDLIATAGVGHHQLRLSQGNTDREVSGQLSLTKVLTEASSLYATVAQKVDAPSIRELYDASSGNAELGFQRAKHYELGLRNHWQQVDVDISLWQTDMKDFIEKDNITDRYENRDNLRFSGLDLSAAYRVNQKLTLNAGLGFLDAEDRSNDRSSDFLQYRPSHKETLQAVYTPTAQWRISSDITRIGSQHYFSRVDSAIHRELSSFELVNAKVNYTLPNLNKKADIYVGIENLLDEEYETSYGFTQPGRFIYTGVKLAL